MRRFLLPLVLALAGCHTYTGVVPCQVEAHVAAVVPVRAAVDAVPCAEQAPTLPESFDLATLWNLTLANNPNLREAAAVIEAARGRLMQARTYPNPRIAAADDSLGTSVAPKGTVTLQVTQEIVTAGKRRLDQAVATRDTDVAQVAMLGRKFDVLTRLRRAYYDYLGWVYTVQVNDDTVAALVQGVEVTRRLVEQVKSRPRTDLLRLEALLEEARTSQSRSRVSLEAAWRELANTVGVPHLPMPVPSQALPEAIPEWPSWLDLEQRVLAAHADLRQAVLEADRVRLEMERARAEAVPNVQVGGGYARSYIEQTAGGIISLETALPLWDRKQGRIHEAEARWTRAQATARSTALRLSRDTADAYARYQGARRQVERLRSEVLPRLIESLALVRKGYQVGSAQITFADVLSAQASLNEAQLRLAEVRRELWRAIAELQGLMQLDLGEETADLSQRG